MPSAIFFAPLVILGVFILPFVVGTLIARSLRMSGHGSSIGLILATIVASLIMIGYGKLRRGVDVAGGTILEYELDKSVQGTNKNVQSKDLIARLMERVNPGGINEIVIRPIGTDRLEVIIPNKDQMEIDDVKKKLQEAGILKFRIVANRVDHRTVIDIATTQAGLPDQMARLRTEIVNPEGEVIGVWHTVGRASEVKEGVQELHTPVQGDIIRNSITGELINLPPGLDPELGVEKYLKKQGISDVDMLMSLVGRDNRPFEVVTGDDIQAVYRDTSNNGSPEVRFTMKAAGGKRLGALTGRNQASNGMKRRMAIILDGRVLSAPSLDSTIYNSGVIHGNFTQKDVVFLQNILQSGSLPAALGKQPISQQQIGAVLGSETIRKAFFASQLAIIGTLLFVAIYYRFSGLIACVALLLNCLYIYASILFLQQPITLPGLAGLVLTVGMSVDANVLVFERMREEIAKRSTARMAIRNGFDRAMTTIIDSNLTTLISAVVLYWLGTDQIKGFAIALIIGILISMFTAVFCSRVLFDIAEKLRIVNFSMSDFVAWMRKAFLGQDDVDFMGYRKICYLVSGVVIAIGLAAVAQRSKGILDIDFNGGTSVTFSLNKPLDDASVRKLIEGTFALDDNRNQIESTVTPINMSQGGDNMVYRVDTSLLDVNDVVFRLKKAFEKSDSTLVTYQLSAKPAGASSSIRSSRKVAHLVSFQPPEAPAGETQPPTGETQPPTGETQPPAAEVQPPANAEPPAPAAEATQPPAEATPAPTAEATQPPPTPAEGTQPPPATTTAPPAEAPAPAAQETPAPTNPSVSGDPLPEAVVVAPKVRSEWELLFKASAGDQSARMNAEMLRKSIEEVSKKVNLPLNINQIEVYPKNPVTGWTLESAAGFDEWKISLPLATEDAQKVVTELQSSVSSQPVWLSLSNIGTRVAGDMQQKAILALIVSNLFIILYIWIRFQKVAYGLAAVIALVHDVLITLGCLAVCHWLWQPLGFLLIQDFKISLTIVAAFLTIIGYSLNDTIVVFDRIREVKGKSPRLTIKMVNQSVNETLGRTLLTSSTTLIVVALLYCLGGEGIHGFSFCLFIGIVVGTYSSIFVAAPILLWLVNREEKKEEARKIRPSAN